MPLVKHGKEPRLATPALPAKPPLRKSDLPPPKLPLLSNSNSSTGSLVLKTGFPVLLKLLKTVSHLDSITSKLIALKLAKLLVQLSRLLVKIWNGLLEKPGKVLNGATTLLHAKLLPLNTVPWPSKMP